MKGRPSGIANHLLLLLLTQGFSGKRLHQRRKVLWLDSLLYCWHRKEDLQNRYLRSTGNFSNQIRTTNCHHQAKLLHDLTLKYLLGHVLHKEHRSCLCRGEFRRQGGFGRFDGRILNYQEKQRPFAVCYLYSCHWRCHPRGSRWPRTLSDTYCRWGWNLPRWHCSSHPLPASRSLCFQTLNSELEQRPISKLLYWLWNRVSFSTVL